MWALYYSKQAKKDAKKLASAGLKNKAQALLAINADVLFIFKSVFICEICGLSTPSIYTIKSVYYTAMSVFYFLHAVLLIETWALVS